MHATTWMKLENTLSEKSQTQISHAEWFHFFVNVLNRQSRSAAAGSLQGRTKEWLLVDTVTLGIDENVPKLDNGDGCTTPWKY